MTHGAMALALLFKEVASTQLTRAYLIMTIIGDASKARILAFGIDHAGAGALMMVAIAFVPESLPLLKAVLFFFMYFAYFVILEALWSRTLGKFFQGLVVRKLDGSRCDWTAALIRSSLRILEVNPFLFGGLPAGMVIIASQRKQRIGDLLAGTVVVSDKLSWESASTEPAAHISEAADLAPPRRSTASILKLTN